ncbi:MAG: exodeoxyribonuclease V subunit gamma [Lautropia sp.]|nr:exodeoxyribonuclease V subunit gamma [Lautropia sp.]
MSDSIRPGFILIHGNQSETLRDLLRDWVRAHPLAPLENEIILVQSNGVAQWLSLSLAADPAADAEAGGGLGIAAALDLQLPSRFIWQAYRQVLGEEAVPVYEPFGKGLMLWRLMRLLPEVVAEPGFEALARFLRDDPQLRRRHQLSGRIADLFDQYQVYRADWLTDWARGHDVLQTQRQGTLPVPDEARWQPLLWRRLLADAGNQAAASTRAAIHQRFIEAAADPQRERPAALPRRVLVFGVSALPRQALDVLAALGRWSQVLICVQNPCRHFWADIVPERDLLSARRFRHRPRTLAGAGAEGLPRQTGIDHGHALLASWGRQGRDLIGLLAEHDNPEAAEQQMHAIRRSADVFVDPGDDTLLRQLQQDILDLEPLTGTRDRWPAVDVRRDDSIRFHVCHSLQREVEVLHDQLLRAFADDASLRPRDVIVMVPDVQAFAPHIEAVFGLYPPDDPRFIPFSIADQTQRNHDPLLRAIEFLLGLPQARLTASEVLDLLDVSALRQCFGIEASALAQIRLWIEQSGIRWGLDQTQRASLDVGEPVDRNSWHFGLQRMLLGYAVGSSGSWAGIEPLDEVSGLAAGLLGQLMALVDALAQTWRECSQPLPPAVWGERLRALLARFFVATDEREALILMRLEDGLQQWLDECVEAGMDLPLPLAVVREHWLAGLDDDSLNRRFFAGAVTFATLMPMRAIPFRQVCLLGMSDREFPRQRQPADFDLMAGDYRPGDRSRREDDRYLFLEALLSARERLYVSWQGRSALDDAEQPPSVLVAQLRDHLAAGWQLADGMAEADAQGRDERHRDERGEELLRALTTSHRLHPFAHAYFMQPDEAVAGDDGLFSYAHEWRLALERVDRIGRDGPHGGPPGGRLEARSLPEAIELDELAAFVARPVRRFFNQRLDVHLGNEEEKNLDIEPFALDGLQRWQLSELLLTEAEHALREGHEAGPVLEAQLQRRLRSGELPVGGFGALLADRVHEALRQPVSDYRQALQTYPHALPDQPLQWPAMQTGDGRLLPAVNGRISSLRADADGARCRLLFSASSLVGEGSKAGGKAWRHDRLLPYWVVHLAAQLEGTALTTLVISPKGKVVLVPVPQAQARAHWQTLLQAWHEGMCRPLPFAPCTAAAWVFESRAAETPGAGMSPDAGTEAPGASKAQAAYEGEEGNQHLKAERDSDPHLKRAFADFEALWSGGAFAVWAGRLLEPLIDNLNEARQGGNAGAGGRGAGDE